jgi:hypothetical protein
VVNVSFFRRLMQRAHKLALLYHIILGKSAIPQIDEIDVAWSMRLTEWHLRDISTAILTKSGNAADMLRGIQALAAKSKAEGKSLSTRDVQQRGPAPLRKTAQHSKNALDAYTNTQG